MFLFIAAAIFVLWLIGLAAHVAGGFINLLLVVAIIMLIAHLLNYRSHRV